MARRTRQHRVQLDRAGITTLTGASSSTIRHWQAHDSRFPAKAATDPAGRDWWWEQDITTFWAHHLAARAAGFTTVDRRGDPHDLLTAPQAARVLGYRSHRNLPHLLLDHPDQVEPLPSGRIRRYWYRTTLWRFADGRPLRHSTGRPPGSRAPVRQPHPYADDPRLAVAIAMVIHAHTSGTGTRGLGATLAAQLGLRRRTAERLIAAARRRLSLS
jgi:hypothetical protein